MFWYWRGRYREGQKWLEEGLAKGDGASAIAQAKALLGVGWQSDGQGDLDGMRKSATEGLTLVEEAGLGDGHRALFLNVLGDVTGQEGDYEQATKLVEESLALSRQANDVKGIVHSLLLLGNASISDQEKARTFYEEGQILSGKLGSAFVRGHFSNGLGLTFLFQGDLKRAAVLFEESANLSRKVGGRVDPIPLCNLGWVALLRGDLEQTKVLHKECLAQARELGDKVRVPEVLEGLACTA